MLTHLSDNQIKITYYGSLKHLMFDFSILCLSIRSDVRKAVNTVCKRGC